MNEHEIADRIADILKRGDAARTSSELRSEIKQRFAPETIDEIWCQPSAG
jgi:hypothetical protein